jgi:cyclase
VLALDVDTIVPGHGPVGGKEELALMRGYLHLVYTAARQCFNAGLPEDEAVASIDVGAYRDWVDADRLVPNVTRAYGEFRGDLATAPAAVDC